MLEVCVAFMLKSAHEHVYLPNTMNYPKLQIMIYYYINDVLP